MNTTSHEEIGFQISHDLKDSLRSISINLDFLMRAIENNDLILAKQITETTRTTSRKLARFMDGLIGLGVASKARADEQVEMKKIVEMAMYSLKNILDKDKIQFEIGQLPQVRVDSLLMEEVWKQLIDNAARHSKSSKIVIGCRPMPSTTIFFIENNGEKIPEELHVKLFSSLVKNSNDDSSIGLGLLFCRRVVERHGGKIWYESDEQMSRFLFEIPNP